MERPDLAQWAVGVVVYGLFLHVRSCVGWSSFLRERLCLHEQSHVSTTFLQNIAFLRNTRFLDNISYLGAQFRFVTGPEILFLRKVMFFFIYLMIATQLVCSRLSIFFSSPAAALLRDWHLCGECWWCVRNCSLQAALWRWRFPIDVREPKGFWEVRGLPGGVKVVLI